MATATIDASMAVRTSLTWMHTQRLHMLAYIRVLGLMIGFDAYEDIRESSQRTFAVSVRAPLSHPGTQTAPMLCIVVILRLAATVFLSTG